MSRRDEIKSRIDELNKKLKVSNNQSTRLTIIGEIDNLKKEYNKLPKENKKPIVVEEKKNDIKNDINRGKVVENVEADPNLLKDDKKDDNKNQHNNNNNKK